MKKIFIFLVLQTALASSNVCRKDFEETLCESFEFSPELTLDSATNKLTIKNATGAIIHEHLSKLDQVTEIKITGSVITGIEPAALCCVPNVTSISIVDNVKFPKITRKVLQGCQQIRKLYLDGREIQIASGAFNQTRNLQTLTLNDTVLPPNLDKAIFTGLDSLKSLTIQHSTCTRIKENVFSGLKNLTFLDLQSNKIETLARDAFKGLSQLRVLNLGDNRLKNLTWDEFQGLKSLKVLFLEGNEFSTVNVDKLVSSVPNLERIFFTYEKLAPDSRKKIEETLPKSNITFIYIGKPV